MTIEIRTSFDNAKLRYTLGYIFNERLDCDYILNPEQSNPKACAILYGVDFECTNRHTIKIPDSGFLHPKGVSVQEIKVEKDDQNNILIFPAENSDGFSFDVFSAIFFMLSRYEEYTCHERDIHGRFDVQHSLSFKEGFHLRAVVDEWIIILRKRLMEYVSEKELKKERPAFSLTVDIDMLFSYRTKGWLRNTAGWFRDLSKGRFKALWQRPAALFGFIQDPFDTFAVLDKISRSYKVPVLFFILAAQQRTAFDKNGNLQHKRAAALLKKLSGESQIGLHPSYYSLDDDAKLLREKNELADIINMPVTASRRHYLRLNLPGSYRQLVKAKFSNDYSMGFASGHGFRAGTSRPFKFFDLETDQVLPLTVHPFSLMDGSLNDYQKLTLQEAETEYHKMADYIKSVNGIFEILIHNETLSESNHWKGWTEMITGVIRNFQSCNK